MPAQQFIADVRDRSRGEPVRIVYRVHRSDGRLRFRLTWLRDTPGAATELADRLADVRGVVEVRVRELTGSVLVLFDPEVADDAMVTRALLDATGCAHVSEPGHESPEDREQMLRHADEHGSAISRALVKTVEGFHEDFLRMTGGRVSLASASALTMLAAGLGQMASTERVELPAWHQLIWYAYQTFKDVQERYAAGHRVHRDGT